MVNYNNFVKNPSAVRQAHGPEQGRKAVLRFIATTKITPLDQVLYVFKTIHVKSVMWKLPASFLTGQAKKHEEKE